MIYDTQTLMECKSEDKEFQLKQIKEARKLLDTYEKLIKENK